MSRSVSLAERLGIDDVLDDELDDDLPENEECDVTYGKYRVEYKRIRIKGRRGMKPRYKRGRILRITIYSSVLITQEEGEFLNRGDGPISFKIAYEDGSKLRMVEIRKVHGTWSGIVGTRCDTPIQAACTYLDFYQNLSEYKDKKLCAVLEAA